MIFINKFGFILETVSSYTLFCKLHHFRGLKKNVSKQEMVKFTKRVNLLQNFS
jgi:hypothetical protein